MSEKVRVLECVLLDEVVSMLNRSLYPVCLRAP